MTSIDLETYLNDSLMMSTPLISDDPAYEQLSYSLGSILEQSARRIGKDLDSITVEEEYLVILYSKLEIFQRLAIATAPEFDVTLEQSSFKKATRFQHYSALAKAVQEEINSSPSIYTLVSKPVTVAQYNGSRRNYNLSKSQNIELEVKTLTSNTVDIVWTKFDTNLGSFYKYKLLYGTKEIYDEFEDVPLDTSRADVVYDFFDINRTSYRLKGLQSNTKYYVVLVAYSKAMAKSIALLEVLTDE